MPIREDSSGKSTPLKKINLYSYEGDFKEEPKSPRVSMETTSPQSGRGYNSKLKSKLLPIEEKIEDGSDEKARKKGVKTKSGPPKEELITEILSRKGSVQSDELPPGKRSKKIRK